MSFFDPKSDVIDIKLTQFGKHLLSKGKWNPFYYSFFDDDILYDSQYGGFSESQNSAQTRITGSARTKTNYCFSGVETEINKQMEQIIDFRKDHVYRTGEDVSEQENIGIQATMDRDYALSLPLGRSDIGNENYPAWFITSLNGLINKSVPYSTSSLGVMPIVQFTMEDVTYKTGVRNKSEEDAQALQLDETLNQIGESAPVADPSDLILANRVYDDGTYISIEEDYLLLEFLEKNTPFEDENIDIEVFKYEPNLQTGREVLVPLKFMKKKQLVVDDILVDDDDPELNQYEELTPQCVEYFFNVWVDDEIDPETLCKAVVERKTEGLYAPPLDCPDPDKAKFLFPNIYGPGLPGQGEPDDCTPEPPCPAEEDE